MKKSNLIIGLSILLLIFLLSNQIFSNHRMKNFIEKDKDAFVYRISDCLTDMEDALESGDIEAIQSAHSEYSIAFIRSRQKYDQLESDLSDKYLDIFDSFQLFSGNKAIPLYNALEDRPVTNVDSDLLEELKVEYRRTTEEIVDLLRYE
ncbi:hypothetical protein EZV73_01640 [Acidaminobacter sp. JC074]|uniref:hypothetical protein n=1 Tax=Acidaminobacter sp. JC074 TaxID=2530199 RepID=UPI001F112167|nr:hypothetical protein [Acidaminobacter sp. JC074]MCH4886247.1 hypothetical protein [Acidaminobacter sp. JC074]